MLITSLSGLRRQIGDADNGTEGSKKEQKVPLADSAWMGLIAVLFRLWGLQLQKVGESLLAGRAVTGHQ
jgi:hypothetical protein